MIATLILGVSLAGAAFLIEQRTYWSHAPVAARVASGGYGSRYFGSGDPYFGGTACPTGGCLFRHERSWAIPVAILLAVGGIGAATAVMLRRGAGAGPARPGL